MNAVTTSETEQTTLYYRERSSDKVYQCSIEPSGDLFVVNFAYGRRGSTLSTGTKTSSPVDYMEAKNIYNRLIREKTAKGYSPGENGTPYQHTDNEQRASGIQCQLLNPIDENQVRELIKDPAWCMQEKLDGRRMLIMKVGPVVTGVNRKGLTIGLPARIMQDAASLRHDCILDGEAIEDTLYVFDLLALDGKNLQEQPYDDRLTALRKLIVEHHLRYVRDIDTATTTEEKEQMLTELYEKGKEGVVLKRLDAPLYARSPKQWRLAAEAQVPGHVLSGCGQSQQATQC